jgi:hypothetical protein
MGRLRVSHPYLRGPVRGFYARPEDELRDAQERLAESLGQPVDATSETLGIRAGHRDVASGRGRREQK